ncbi:MAG: paraquat-inducible protein A [Sulfitobacter sp.]
MGKLMGLLRLLNLSLLVLYPLSWFAPLMRAGLLPLFGLSEISVITGLQSLWSSSMFLATLVALFALVAPYVKTIGLALIHTGRIGTRLKPVLDGLGRLAMADIFLIALYITITKGIGVGRIEVAWGLYLFTFCILTSLFISWKTPQSMHFGHS